MSVDSVDCYDNRLRTMRNGAGRLESRKAKKRVTLAAAMLRKMRSCHVADPNKGG